MLVGAINDFAIETGLTKPFEKPSLRGLGFFVLYIGGKCFGVKRADATMLANSYDAVQERIVKKGKHLAPFLEKENADAIVDAVHTAFYEDSENRYFFGLSSDAFQDVLISNGILWAPDGDEAFDDGSHVLHLDETNGDIRLIGFINSDNRKQMLSSIAEVRMNSESFYSILLKWEDNFISEWRKAF